jgi:hypothetical protein
MNRMRQLIKMWESESSAEPAVNEVSLKLTTGDYARLCALEDIFPDRTREQLLSDLFATALDEFEEALPYIPGKKVVAEDEFGDPLYEDMGLTPKFEALSRQYYARFKAKQA